MLKDIGYKLPINSVNGVINKGKQHPIITHHLLTFNIDGNYEVHTIFITTKHTFLFGGQGISLN